MRLIRRAGTPGLPHGYLRWVGRYSPLELVEVHHAVAVLVGPAENLRRLGLQPFVRVRSP